MKQKLFIAFAALFCSSELYAQDTTGSTRPTVIIPLHKSDRKKNRAKDPATVPYKIDSARTEALPINADDRKLKQARKKKKAIRRNT